MSRTKQLNVRVDNMLPALTMWKYKDILIKNPIYRFLLLIVLSCLMSQEIWHIYYFHCFLAECHDQGSSCSVVPVLLVLCMPCHISYICNFEVLPSLSNLKIAKVRDKRSHSTRNFIRINQRAVVINHFKKIVYDCEWKNNWAWHPLQHCHTAKIHRPIPPQWWYLSTVIFFPFRSVTHRLQW